MIGYFLVLRNSEPILIIKVDKKKRLTKPINISNKPFPEL
jgi:hypothetical protein